MQVLELEVGPRSPANKGQWIWKLITNIVFPLKIERSYYKANCNFLGRLYSSDLSQGCSDILFLTEEIKSRLLKCRICRILNELPVNFLLFVLQGMIVSLLCGDYLSGEKCCQNLLVIPRMPPDGKWKPPLPFYAPLPPPPSSHRNCEHVIFGCHQLWRLTCTSEGYRLVLWYEDNVYWVLRMFMGIRSISGSKYGCAPE